MPCSSPSSGSQSEEQKQASNAHTISRNEPRGATSLPYLDLMSNEHKLPLYAIADTEVKMAVRKNGVVEISREKEGRPSRGYTRDAAIRPNSVTRSEPEMTVSPLQTRPSKVWTTPDHEQFAVLVLEMAAQRPSLEADGVLLGQKCPIFMPEQPATPPGPVNSIRETSCSCQKRNLLASVRAAIGSDRSVPCVALKKRPEHDSVQNLELNVRFFPFRERIRDSASTIVVPIRSGPKMSWKIARRNFRGFGRTTPYCGEAEAGSPIKAVCAAHNISTATYHVWNVEQHGSCAGKTQEKPFRTGMLSPKPAQTTR